ncbi:serine/threonine-protein kinase [Marinactinospora rubrisoli]|uniref:Serine/threonine-protein kinase n=1 Tax=Marinactinospora rubrisoli TaxID=2715399 RepID=A0ABW2KBK7_9ACTN
MPSDGLPKNLEPLAAGDPATIGPYVLAGRLGSGGMGTVYLGRSPEKGAHVAIKVIRPELAFDEATRARFRDEMENARRVASFCTAKVLDHGSFENRPYMVTEYIAGTALAEHIATHGPLDSSTLHGFALGIAAALAAIHGAGLVHRDLKPANVLLSLSGPRVIDFGIARALNTATNHTQTGIVMGSPGWMAPEQLLEEKVTTAADIFAWGCLVAFAGTGAHPFGNGDAMTLGKRVLFAEPQITGLDSPLDRLVAKALAKEPERRPKAQDLLLELAGAGGDANTPDPNAMVSHALHQSWRPNLPPMPPMPPQGPPPGAHQTLTGMRHPHAPGPGPAQPYPPQGGQPGGGPHPAGGMPPQQSQQPPGQPQQRMPAPPGHHTGQFPTVSPQHTGPIPPVGPPQGQPNQQQAPSRPQAQPYVPPVPPPPHTPLEPARRTRWLVIAGVVAVVLLILLFSTLTMLSSNGFSLPWKDTTSGSQDEQADEQPGSSGAPQSPGAGAEEDGGADSASDGVLRFQLTDYTCTTQVGGRSGLQNGQYCVFSVAARNTSGDPVRIRPEWQLLQGSGGQLAPAEDPSAEEAMAPLWGSIEPNERAEGELVFIVNDGVEPLQLVLRSRENVEGARIDLSGATEPA